MPDLYLPVFWISESFEMPHNVSDQLLIVTNVLPTFVPYLWFIMALSGFVMLVLSIYLWIIRKHKAFIVLNPM